ncbi:MAG: NADH-quinone oxidoreductase subunit N [Sulfurimonas sp.]|nr:NADH-quinone oxidoreductase subunit N [Sulfurimonas sp.]MBU1216879.1 NADH-quinone oxidoreductase subunit N [bacterium]MBU1435006.1 NADH-quinone oxidoreductase subunit N [bacterium]MBU1504111.1 NADH-quinone oxidoreductase subunit N [bacterium]MBU3939963.1 NADH-quinone oxidoreductase subunit N [bacterium]
MIDQLLLAFPMAIVVIGAFVLMLLSHSKKFTLERLNLVGVLFLTISFVMQYQTLGAHSKDFLFEDVFGRSFILDDFATLFDLMFTAGAILTLLINNDYFKSRRYFSGEYFALLLFSVFGMMMLSHAHELVTAFIALEIASISVYALVGYHKQNKVSSEAMMKYMVLGSMTGAFFMLGTALIYGAVGSTSLTEISAYVAQGELHNMTLLIVGATFIMVTILFKIGAVPFHSWVVDVYHGAPYPVTMFMASTFKIAIFAIALRLYIVNFAPINNFWTEILQVITILTLLGGSWLAISQNIIKRMLAGSSIVHSGYLLIAISSIGLGSELAAPAVMFYLLAYFLSAAGSFGILSFIASQTKGQMSYEDFKGFAERRPYMALFMSIFMLSLAGFPSTIGFLGKFYIFTSAIESGQILLAGLGILTAFISVYYYFKLIAMMYFYPSQTSQEKFPVNVSTLLIAMMAMLIIWGGIGTSLIPFVPGADGFIDSAKQAISSLQ